MKRVDREPVYTQEVTDTLEQIGLSSDQVQAMITAGLLVIARDQQTEFDQHIEGLLLRYQEIKKQYDNLRKVLDEGRKRLYSLKLKQASLGFGADSSIALEIENLTAFFTKCDEGSMSNKIAILEALMRGVDVTMKKINPLGLAAPIAEIIYLERRGGDFDSIERILSQLEPIPHF